MEKTVVILGGELAPEGRSLLEEAGASVIATPPYIDRQAVIETMKAHRPDAVIVRLLADLLGSEEMQAGGRLRHIAKHGVGTNDIDVKSATALGIPVSMTTGSNGHSVAEHALALIMALVKDLPRQDALIRDGIWDKNQYKGRELRGQRLGLVGFGFIGQTLAKMAGAIGMTVSAFDPHAPDSAFGDEVTDRIVDHRRGDAGVEAEAVGEVRRAVKLAAADVDVAVRGFAERDRTRVEAVDESAEGQEVQRGRARC